MESCSGHMVFLISLCHLSLFVYGLVQSTLFSTWYFLQITIFPQYFMTSIYIIISWTCYIFDSFKHKHCLFMFSPTYPGGLLKTHWYRSLYKSRFINSIYQFFTHFKHGYNMNRTNISHAISSKKWEHHILSELLTNGVTVQRIHWLTDLLSYSIILMLGCLD